MFIRLAMWHPTLVVRQIEWSQNKPGADTSTHRSSVFPLLAIGQIVKTSPTYLGPRLHIAAVLEVRTAFCRWRSALMAPRETQPHDNSKTEQYYRYANSVQYLCRFMRVCYCVRVPQRDDSDLFYFSQSNQKCVFIYHKAKNNILQNAEYLLKSQNIPRTMQRAWPTFWLNFHHLLKKPFWNKGFHSSRRGYILEQRRPEMAPTTTGLEAGSSSTHTVSHSDLGEKQAFKQVACLSAGGECQPLVLP